MGISGLLQLAGIAWENQQLKSRLRRHEAVVGAAREYVKMMERVSSLPPRMTYTNLDTLEQLYQNLRVAVEDAGEL